MEQNQPSVTDDGNPVDGDNQAAVLQPDLNKSMDTEDGSVSSHNLDKVADIEGKTKVLGQVNRSLRNLFPKDDKEKDDEEPDVAAMIKYVENLEPSSSQTQTQSQLENADKKDFPIVVSVSTPDDENNSAESEKSDDGKPDESEPKIPHQKDSSPQKENGIYSAVAAPSNIANDKNLKPDSNDVDSYDSPAPLRVSGWKQFGSLMRKNLLLKMRTPMFTFFEIFCPFAMVWILHAAFMAAGTASEEDSHYSTLSFDVPGLVGNMFFSNSTATGLPSLYNESMMGLNSSSEDEFLITEEDFAYFEAERDNLDKLLRQPIPYPTLDLFLRAHSRIAPYYKNSTMGNKIDGLEDSEIFRRRWGHLLALGTVHVVDDSLNSSVGKDFVRYVYDKYADYKHLLNLVVWNNEADALDFIEERNLDEKTWALINFSEKNTNIVSDENVLSEEDHNIVYAIRMNNTVTPKPRFYIATAAVGFKNYYMYYLSSGYPSWQRTVNEFFLSRANDGKCWVPGENDIWAIPMPTAAYDQNEFYQAIGFLMGIALAMAYLFPISRLVKSIVEEKESRMKQTLFILGVKQWAHWLSWVVFTVGFFMIISLFVTGMLAAGIAQNSNFALLYIYVMAFALSIISFTFFVASFISNAKVASIVGPMAFFATLLPRYIFLATSTDQARHEKMLASVLPCTAFAFGAETLTDFEAAEVGVQWWNMSSGGYDFGTSLTMLLIDSVLYMVLAWYLEQVLPSQFGVRRKFYFCLTPGYWRRIFGLGKDHDYLGDDELDEDGQHQCSMKNVQRIDDSESPQVRVQSLVKRYKKGMKPAVNNLSLNLYEDQITCLLGHNGAGKSTTMSVLTGLFPPSSGDCIIYNKSIRKDLDQLRQSMGICPQHNVLFDTLTVYEHIRFFESVKGAQPTHESIVAKAREVELEDKLHTYSMALSGGMKRKLCVAMALCGDPKFVLFDEPTSGMDPHTRRATWDLLRKKKKGRVLMLTTHFMEEAELLADRIAVLKSGKLQCYGTGLFLKERFGVGYNLTMVIDRAVTGVDQEEGNISLSPEQLQTENLKMEQRIQDITTFLSEYIPDVELLRRSARELVYRFPPGSEIHFPKLFHTIENDNDTRMKLGIGGYGVSNTTLEEVFLRLADEKDAELEDTTPREISIEMPNAAVSPSRQTSSRVLGSTNGETLSRRQTESVKMLDRVENECAEFHQVGRFSQIGILMGKRWTVQKRDKRGIFYQVLLPAIGVAVALLCLTFDFFAVEPALEISLDYYHGATRIANSDAVVSGRMGPNDNQSMSDVFDFMDAGFQYQYPEVRLEYKPDLLNSTEMSHYLLDSYHDHSSHYWRFGAYQFNDAITMNLNINWTQVEDIILNFDPETVGDNGIIEYDSGSAAPLYSVTFDLKDVADIVYSFPNIEPDTPIDMEYIRDYLVDELAGGNQASGIAQALTFALSGFFRAETVSDLFDIIDRNTGGSGDLDATYTVSVQGLTIDLVEESLLVRDIIIILEDMQRERVDIDSVKIILFPEPIFVINNLLYKGQSMLPSPTGQLVITGVTLREIEELLEQTLGGVINVDFGGEEDFNSTYEYIAYYLPEGIETKKKNIFPEVSFLFNTSAMHSLPATYQGYMEYQYKNCTNNLDARIVSINHPLPLSEAGSLEVKAQLSVLATLFVLMPMCYAPSAYIIFLVKERACKSKHLQLVSGVDLLAYWFANYLWDMATWLVFTILVIVVFFIYGSGSAEVFVGEPVSSLCTFLLIFGYGLSGLPFAYNLSRYFTNYTTAQISILGGFFITGFVTVLVYIILTQLEGFEDMIATLQPFFRIFPAYNMGEGLIELSKNFFSRNIGLTQDGPFSPNVCGTNLLLLYGLSIPYFFILMCLEYSGDGGSGGFIGSFLRYIGSHFNQLMLRWHGVKAVELQQDTMELDNDVRNEKEYVMKNVDELKSSAPVLLADIWKVFPPSKGSLQRKLGEAKQFLKNCFRKEKIQVEADPSTKAKKAIQGLSTAVMGGETFGLLGINGAGKTTTMAVLTGDLSPTSGEAYVAGYDVTGKTTGGLIQARKHIGFCPQIDPLLEKMTARETLKMYGRLRGIPVQKLDVIVEDLMEALTLTPHADKPSGKYSGGNKRKLSVGIAIIGNPKVLFIDEASSGMDPVARRRMWELISVIGRNRSVILTTHSMEEAEALCSRIGIMVAGQLRCLGSVQHLKTTYLDGYTVDLQCKYGSPSHVFDKVISHILTVALPGSSLDERHGRFLRFNIPSMAQSNEHGGLGNTFQRLEKMKSDPDFLIENYSISQCTLEQVFISLVKKNATTKNILEDDPDEGEIGRV